MHFCLNHGTMYVHLNSGNYKILKVKFSRKNNYFFFAINTKNYKALKNKFFKRSCHKINY